jgi:colanic acid/amylovoran biosynthesis glycosyltransferase
MRIAMIVGRFPVLSETFVARQMAGLAELGHDLDVYAELRGDPSELEPSLRTELLSRTRYVDMPRASANELAARPVRGPASLLRTGRALPAAAVAMRRNPRLAVRTLRRSEYRDQASSLSALYRLAACSRGRGYDVAHAHFGPIGESYRFVGELWHAPLVVTFHGHDMSSWPAQARPGALESVFAAADAVTAVSADGARRLERLGCPPEKLHELPMPIALERFPFRERTLEPGESPRILSVARLTEKKGIEYAIRAVARARESHPDLRYDIVGTGPLRESLVALARELGVSDAVTFHGGRGQDFVRELLEQSHLFLLPSVTASNGDAEGAPLSLVEAQACGLPVLSTMHAGIPEAVPAGASRFLAPERDVDTLATRLSELLEHPERWPEIGRAGRRHVEQRNGNAVLAPRLVQLYERLASEVHPRFTSSL